MTEHDHLLIAKAENIHHIDWMRVNELIDSAETAEAREILKRIRRYLIHLDKN